MNRDLMRFFHHGGLRVLQREVRGIALRRTRQVRGTLGEDDPPFYILRDDVEIPADIDLRIEAGTEIYCMSGSRLTVHGGLRIEGEAVMSAT